MSNVEGMYFVYFIKRLSKAKPPFEILRFDILRFAFLMIPPFVILQSSFDIPIVIRHSSFDIIHFFPCFQAGFYLGELIHVRVG